MSQSLTAVTSQDKLTLKRGYSSYLMQTHTRCHSTVLQNDTTCLAGTSKHGDQNEQFNAD
jgi:hypothetical protein